MALTTVTWTGSSGLWSDGTNWSSGSEPATNSSAQLTGSSSYTVTVAASALVASLKNAASPGQAGLVVGNANATLNIGTSSTSGVTLTVGNALSNNKPSVELDAGTIQTVNGGILAIAGGNLNQTGGTLDVADSGTVSVGGALNQSGGTIALSSGSLAVTGALNETGGLIDITGGVASFGSISLSSGTIRISSGSLTDSGALVQSGGLLDVFGGTFTAGSMTVNSAAAGVDITAGGLLVAGSLNESAGTIGIAGGTLRITGALAQSGGTIVLSSSGTLQLYDVSGSGSVDMGALGSNSTVNWTNTVTTDLSGLTLNNFYTGSQLNVATTGAVTNLTTAWSAGVLTVTGDGGFSFSVQIPAGASSPTSANFFAVSTGSTVRITTDLPCFLAGTRITTLRGEVAVEDLRIGDLVATAAGAQPIKWIGTRSFIARLVEAGQRASLMPIRIAAGAIADGIPARDLYVSPEHRLCFDDALIAAEDLLNGTTVTRADDIAAVRYFHVELPRHAVLYAEGAPAESYLDTGSRNQFANVLSYLDLDSDPDAPPPQPCLPTLTEGAALEGVRARLAERAGALGRATTDEDGLYLDVDGLAVHPESLEDDRVRFAVPAGARRVRIVSRSVVPADLDPASPDRRRLGVCFSVMTLDDGEFTLALPAAHAGFVTGFHEAEIDHRWTAGDALLPEDLTAAMPNGFVLMLKLISRVTYPAPTQAEVIPLRRSA
jgi:antigen 43